MIVVGVDPGKRGGVAVMNEAGHLTHLAPMPTKPAAATGKQREDYDLAEIRRLLVEIHAAAVGVSDPLLVVIEQLDAMPMIRHGRPLGGTIANFQRGFATGVWLGLCQGLGLRYQQVIPRVWQSLMLPKGKGDTKARALEAAQRRFPGESFLRTARSRKPDDGLVDASLIADYGRVVFALGRGRVS